MDQPVDVLPQQPVDVLPQQPVEDLTQQSVDDFPPGPSRSPSASDDVTDDGGEENTEPAIGRMSARTPRQGRPPVASTSSRNSTPGHGGRQGRAVARPEVSPPTRRRDPPQTPTRPGAVRTHPNKWEQRIALRRGSPQKHRELSPRAPSTAALMGKACDGDREGRAADRCEASPPTRHRGAPLAPQKVGAAAPKTGARDPSRSGASSTSEYAFGKRVRQPRGGGNASQPDMTLANRPSSTASATNPRRMNGSRPAPLEKDAASQLTLAPAE